jgi:hypothetical protein
VTTTFVRGPAMASIWAMLASTSSLTVSIAARQIAAGAAGGR